MQGWPANSGRPILLPSWRFRLKIKNWSKFQHFKNRCPPWIKLHREILDRRDINVISDRSFRVLINLWLLASEDKGKSGNVPNVQDIAFRTRLPEKYIIEAIQELGEFIEYDSEDIDINAISERYQLGPPEGEGETEKKVPCTKPNGSLRAHGVDLPHHTDTNKPLNKPVNKPQPNSNTSSPPASDLKRVPFQDIKSLYHKILPELPECKKLTPKRMGYIRAIWADGLPDLEHWEKFFNAIRGSKFLMGQTEAGRGRAKPFRADLEWITNPTNYVKIFEGKYHE